MIVSESKRLGPSLSRDLYVLEDENNPRESQVNGIWGSTILDQVFDQLSPTNKNLREILADLKQEIITGGKGNIVFPVTSVNGKTEDVVLTANDFGLGRVDNTRDMDKPLSVPQRTAIMEILAGYDFNVNLDDLYSHLVDTSNPHDVTVEQINKDDNLAQFVKTYIAAHNNSTHQNIHMDIRRSLSTLWNLTDDLNNNLEDRVGNVLNAMDDHVKDDLAHSDIMKKKEDIENKSMSFTTTTDNDHTKYPSTRAVVEFVANRLIEFKQTLPDLKEWISDIEVIDDYKALPEPTSRYVRKAYVIRYTNTSYADIAICRANPDGKTYSWDTSHLGLYSKFNKRYFADSVDGLTVRIDSIIDAILSENGMLDTSLAEILRAYYTKKEIDEFKFVTHVKILPGVSAGSIRYYINDDMETMSEDIRIPGLQRLAFLEWITEDQLWDQCIHSRHIISKSIEKRHLQEKIIGLENMTCDYGFLIGNTEDSTGDSVNKVSLTKLADWLRPLIGGWPDPNVPGGNPWSEMMSEQIMHPHLWEPGVEVPLHDHSYAMRFKGTISTLPNKYHEVHLTDKIKLDEYRITEAGGSWQYQSNPDEWTVLGGSNITGHTYGTVKMTKDGLFLETLSVGDRYEAKYDVWVKYVKPAELEQLLHPQS